MKIWWLMVFFLLLDFQTDIFSQDVPSKSNSKVSDFKPKLASTELTAKPSITAKPEDDSDNILISDLGVSLPPEYANERIERDHHTYYNVTFFSPDKDFWVNFEDSAVIHKKLSTSYRKAATVQLPFDFPFYGYPVRNVTIATGGFLYMGDYLHDRIAAIQYIAPLMANFDTTLSPNSVIKYADNGTTFSVLWENVFLQNRQSSGAFTFQTTLFQNGDFVFAYKDIPVAISSISDSQHPVKVGLSDAYVLDRSLLFIRRKLVNEYHRLHITKWEIANNTALYFTALRTCNSFKDCSSCMTKTADFSLKCSWCEAVQRCSDGIDRQTQSWNEHGCTVNRGMTCPPIGVRTTPSSDKINVFSGKDSENKSSTSKSGSVYHVDTSTNDIDVFEGEESSEPWNHEVSSETKSTASAVAIATILVFLIVIVVSVSLWILYANKNPQSSSAHFLKKFRPTQWGAEERQHSLNIKLPSFLKASKSFDLQTTK